MDSISVTSISLLTRVKNTHDQSAWRDFVDRYGGRVYKWARRHGLQPADAEDVTQEVLAKLVTALRKYDPLKGSFRAWLKTVTTTTWADFLKHRRKAGQGRGDVTLWEHLADVPARDELTELLQQDFDCELAQMANELTRTRCSPQAWEVFRLRCDEQLPFKDIATRLAMSEAAAKMSFVRTRDKVRDQFQLLQGCVNDKRPT